MSTNSINPANQTIFLSLHADIAGNTTTSHVYSTELLFTVLDIRLFYLDLIEAILGFYTIYKHPISPVNLIKWSRVPRALVRGADATKFELYFTMNIHHET